MPYILINIILNYYDGYTLWKKTKKMQYDYNVLFKLVNEILCISLNIYDQMDIFEEKITVRMKTAFTLVKFWSFTRDRYCETNDKRLVTDLLSFNILIML